MSFGHISILVCEPLSNEGLTILKQANFKIDVCLNLDKKALCEKIPDYHCLLVRSQTKVDGEVIEHGKNLKLIGRAGVGINNIDVEAARKRGISVINTPSGNSISTAEFAFGLLLALARKIAFAQKSLKSGMWERKSFVGTELFGKNLGIIGFGNVGRLVSQRARAFGMRVIGFDPLVDRSIFTEYGAEKRQLDEILAEADFLTLHCGLNEHTEELINHETINKMKPGVAIINAARGELINAQDMLEGLARAHISCAALDVFAKEPPAHNDPLLHHDRILVTPHLGASTEEAQTRVSTLLAEQTVAFFS